MNYIQCPTSVKDNIYDAWNHGRPRLFLAGGITGCGNWQVDFAKKFDNTKWTIVNPRRDNFTSDITEEEQVTWEYNAMSWCNYIMFWFTPPTLNPITLFEYGKALENREQFHKDCIFVGIHPKYEKRENIIIQTKLARPKSKIIIYDNLDDLAQAVLSHPI